VSDWRSDFRYAFRALLRQPTFASIALLTLALGIGANTAIFSIIKTVLLNPLPYPDPERIVVLWEVNPERTTDQVSVPTYLDWQKESRTIESMAAYRHVDFSYAGGDKPRDVPSLLATPELFRVLRTEASLGRTFTAEEATWGKDKVVVLSHGFWQRALGGSPDVIGRALVLGSLPYTIVGVMPASFQFPTATEVELWTPLAFNPNDGHGRSRRARSLMVVGRMAPDATPEQAQEEMSVLAGRIALAHPESNQDWGARVVAAHEQLVAASRPALVVLMGAVGFLLLIVCANMANLLLARLSGRRKEIAIRGALGASRWELVRPVMAESLLLALTGGALGLLLAAGGLRLFTTLPEGRLPRMDEVRLDNGVLLFSFGLSVAVALAFGLMPALHLSRTAPRTILNEETGTTGSFSARRILNGLVVVEVALALVLLVGAGLMTRSFMKLLQVNPGFDPSNVMTAHVMVPQAKYPKPTDRVRFFDSAVERVRTAPGIRAASAVSSLPMHSVGVTFALPFNVQGQPPPTTFDPRADVRMTAPGYFETMRIPLFKGRTLDERDTMEAPKTCVINETMARRFFAGVDPLGKIIENPHGRSEIVGVVADVHTQGLDSDPRPQVYLPMRQNPVGAMAIVARTERDPFLSAATVEQAIWAVDSEQPIYDLSTMDQVLARAVFLPRLSTTLLVGFAAGALLLAALGIYGVLSYSVTQRTREIGLRMALGAGGGDTVGLVVGSSMVLIGIGVVIGLVAATVLARSMTGILYGVGPFDLPAFGAAGLVLIVAGLTASVVPARRASRVDPMVALREP
jgi:putative ABC transport system permease protein